MKILIHALGANMGGALRHLTSFLPALGAYDRQNEYVVLIREGVPPFDLPSNITLRRVPDRLAGSWLTRLGFDNLLLPLSVRLSQFDVVVSLTNFGPTIAGAPHVLFQRNALYFSDFHFDRIESARERFESELRSWLSYQLIRFADTIVTPSESMGEMIQQRHPEFGSRRFRTLYHGFVPSAYETPLQEPFISRLGDGDEYLRLLYPSHPARHKAYDVLFEAVAALAGRRRDFKLYLTIDAEKWPQFMPAYKAQIAQLGVADHVVFLGRIPPEQMGALYSACDLMVYPSLCESFGFSMVEALAHELPIVASDTPINREMCGEGALFYAPFDADAAAEAIDLALDPQTRQTLLDRGTERLEAFDWGWERYAREFVAIVEEAVR